MIWPDLTWPLHVNYPYPFNSFRREINDMYLVIFDNDDSWVFTWHLPGPRDWEEDGQHRPSEPVEVEPEQDQSEASI